MLNNCRLV